MSFELEKRYLNRKTGLVNEAALRMDTVELPTPCQL